MIRADPCIRCLSHPEAGHLARATAAQQRVTASSAAAGNFQGVKFSQANSDLDSVLQVVGATNLEIYNSVFNKLPASLRIASGSVQIANSNFTNIQGNTAGGLIIDRAVVDITSSRFSNSQSQSGRAVPCSSCGGDVSGACRNAGQPLVVVLTIHHVTVQMHADFTLSMHPYPCLLNASRPCLPLHDFMHSNTISDGTSRGSVPMKSHLMQIMRHPYATCLTSLL